MKINWHDVLVAAEHLAGFVVVMVTLLVLWGLTVVSGKVVARLEAMRPKPAPVVPEPAAAPATGPAAATGDDGVSDEELVVIAATVATMIDGRHRVVSVRPVPSSWGQQGRREIHASHRIR